MIWLLITLSMGIGVAIGITAYSNAFPTKIELPRTPCEYDQLDETYRDSPTTRQVKDEI